MSLFTYKLKLNGAFFSLPVIGFIFRNFWHFGDTALLVPHFLKE